MRRSPLTLLAAAALTGLTGACGDSYPTLKQAPIDGPPLTVPPVAEDRLPSDPAVCAPSDTCEDGDPCTENRCLDGACVALPIPTGACCEAEVLFSEAFDDGAAAAVTLSAPVGGAGWHVLDHRAASPPGSLYFGDPESMSYDTGARVSGTATLPPLDLPADRESHLTMRLMALVEPNATFDRVWIEADVLDGETVSQTVELLRKASLPAEAKDSFALVDVSLTELAGQRIQIRIAFDSMDHLNNAFEGVWVDDIAVQATCPLLGACLEDADCDDGDPCTADACSPEGCVTGDLCGPEDPVLEPCAGPDAPADCCTSDADCEDGDPATVDTCEGATCVVTLNPDACLSDADCDDGEACTTDTCNAGLCEHEGASSGECCVAGDQLIANFDTGKLQGIYVTDNLETGVFWTPDKTRATSGNYSLYMGDPVPQTYARGVRVKASATTPVLTLPKGGSTRLTFDLFKVTRQAKNYDVLQVFVLRDGALLPAWTSKSLTNGVTGDRFEAIEVPLDAYAGQQIQLRFVFDSVDAATAPLEGTYVDGLQLGTVCD